MLSYHVFRQSERGRVVCDLAAHSVVVMENLSQRGEPAVAAIDAAVADRIGRLDDTERQHAGRVVRDILAPRGWRPRLQRKRLRNGRAFASGAVYERQAAIDLDRPFALPGFSRSDRLARADEAVAILAATRTGSAGTVDDFVAERRAEAHRDDAGR